jgi:hypothetical protein
MRDPERLGWRGGQGSGFYATAFFSSAPALNFGTVFAAIWIDSPLLGLRPSRAARWTAANLSKPAFEALSA